MENQSKLSLCFGKVNNFPRFDEKKTFFSFRRFASIGLEGSVYIFGGESSAGKQNTIAKFSNEKWYKIGQLNNKRSGLQAIRNENNVLLVGGISDGINIRFNIDFHYHAII